MAAAHTELRELAAAYALDALPADERAFFERHLEACPDCRAEVGAFRETAAVLAASTPVAVPAGTREDVLARLDATPQERPAGTRPAAGSGPAGGAAPAVPHRAPVLAPVAAALLLAVLGMSGVALYLLGGTATTAAPLDEAFLATATAVPLDAPAGASATFYWSTEQDEGWLAVAGLEALPADRAYQLWVFQEGSPVPAGVFHVAEGRALVRSDAPVRGAQTVAVTVEPAGGLPAPSGPVVLSAEL